MSNLCPACGHENRENARFCAECGREILTAVAVPVNGTAAHGQAGRSEATARAAVDERDVALRAATSDVDSDAELTGNTEPGNTEPGNADPNNEELSAGLLGDKDAGIKDAGIENAWIENADMADMSSDPPDGEAGGSGEDFAPGVLIGGRFLVLSTGADAAGREVCQVEDHGVCRACGAEMTAAEMTAVEEEPFCTNCGAHWLGLALPWPRRWLREAGPEDAASAQFPWDGCAFVLAGDDTTASEEQGETIGAAPAAAGGVTLLAGQRSDVGEGRAGRPNEDSLLALTAAGSPSLALDAVGLYLVADGMGGHQDGEIASRTACAVIRADLLEGVILPALDGAVLDPAAVEEAITQAVGHANREIGALAAATGSNMGTTVVLALALREEVYLANAGDSRAYLWERAGLRQVTVDHSHVFLLMQKGVIEPEEIYTHPRRNEIYRSLGSAHNVEVDCFRETLAPGDLLLLCSDGLWEMLRDEGIADVLLLNLSDPQAICDELVRRANLAGGDDNISVIAVRAGRQAQVEGQVRA